MSTAPVDLRHFSRVPFASHVRLVGNHGSVDARLIDISLKGALVARPPGWDVAVGAPMELELLLGEGSLDRIQMQTRVAHVEQDHLGLHCQHIDLDSVTHLRRLVEVNLGNSVLLDRELAAMG